MFSVKVDVKHRQPANGVELPLSRAASASNAVDLASDEIRFSAGNPRVEYVTGVVHLYREVAPTGAASAPAQSQPIEERGSQLAVLAVSPDMGVSDFCTWAGGYLPSIREMRFVRRDDSRASCLVLLHFDTPAMAATFHRERNDKPFWTMEPDVICRLLFVKDLQVEEDGSTGVGSSSSAALALPLPGQTELPTCPVCLERLDAHISGVVTTVCNHKFHNECLRRWEDVSCPVCRYALNREGHVSKCTTCAASVDLWICLICGHVGCGRYRSGHANGHWKETDHRFSLELETQRVWDYASDGYVHRLIQSKTDGKLVEVPSPLPAARGEAQPDAAAGSAEERYDADVHEAMVASKLDAIGTEYNHLLTSQLTAQREWFETRHAQDIAQLEARCTELAAAAARNEKAAKAATAATADATSQRNVVETKLEKVSQKVWDTAKERDVLNALNASLRANQAALKERMAADADKAAAVLKQRDAELIDLRDQVRDLMMFIEGQRLVKEAAPDMGLQQGSSGVVATTAPATSPSKRRPGRRR